MSCADVGSFEAAVAEKVRLGEDPERQQREEASETSSKNTGHFLEIIDYYHRTKRLNLKTERKHSHFLSAEIRENRSKRTVAHFPAGFSFFRGGGGGSKVFLVALAQV